MKLNKDGFGYIKIKDFCSIKDTIDEINRYMTDWEKISVISKTVNRLISRLQKEL